MRCIINKLCESIPAENNSEQSFYAFIQKQLAEYCEFLNRINEEDLISISKDEMCGNVTKRRFINLIKKINRECLSILCLSYQGDIVNASEKLRKFLFSINITGQYLKDLLINYFGFNRQINRLYRCRKVEKGVVPDDCWHIPFNLKDYTSSNRFNQIGCICLYLADSPDSALRSIGSRNGNEEVWVGLFEPCNTINFLALVIPTEDEISRMDNYDIFAFLITYPFMLLCLTKCKNPEARYHEEYSFSQLFFHLLFITNGKGFPYFNGICYSAINDRTALNFVIPAKYDPREPPKNNRSQYIESLFIENQKIYKI